MIESRYVFTAGQFELWDGHEYTPLSSGSQIAHTKVRFMAGGIVTGGTGFTMPFLTAANDAAWADDTTGAQHADGYHCAAAGIYDVSVACSGYAQDANVYQAALFVLVNGAIVLQSPWVAVFAQAKACGPLSFDNSIRCAAGDVMTVQFGCSGGNMAIATPVILTVDYLGQAA